MPTFRNRNSGQTVTLHDDPSYLSGLARWERIEEGSSTPDEAKTAVSAATEAAKAAQAELEAANDEAAVSLVALTAQLEMPAADADRDEWVAYAKAQGKTDAQLKGKKIDTIRGWFVADE
ncbi:hypothetical protein [Rhodococcus rhodochrous]|uniref:hypothetical protein n=1 Tax=Rhodococcus rhodochrous TaxID=1829 RepID=UPI00177D06A3|nr:hypothetical protein [Rhodococcus rhodochrous]QOH59893.1 hypothetical protein C6Y44_27775 [Rhodococcus rhodochrous]